jgi:hypothetical protein
MSKNAYDIGTNYQANAQHIIVFNAVVSAKVYND